MTIGKTDGIVVYKIGLCWDRVENLCDALPLIL
jgi:hypothetical protein